MLATVSWTATDASAPTLRTRSRPYAMHDGQDLSSARSTAAAPNPSRSAWGCRRGPGSATRRDEAAMQGSKHYGATHLSPTFQRPLALDNPARLAVLGYYQDGNAESHVGLAEFAVNFLVPSPPFGAPFVGRWATFDDFLGSGAAPQIELSRAHCSPEPSTLMLLLLALAAGITVKRKRWLV
jgi:hypothetical protein